MEKIKLSRPRVRRPRLAFVLMLLVIMGSPMIASMPVSRNIQNIEVLSKTGSRGSEVRQIQTKLKNWGYYKGNVDGIFGSKTREAVLWFQRKNGLTPDGIAGPATLAAMGIFTKSSSPSSTGGQSNINLLARLISAESRGEPYTGQVAVGAVVLNRMEHPSFPDTMAGVIYQQDAFTCLQDGEFNKPVAESAYRAARDAMNGWDPSGGAIYYYNPRTATNAWIRKRPVVTTIGTHLFCM